MWMHPAFHGSRGSFCHVTQRQTVWQWSVSVCCTTPFLEKLEHCVYKNANRQNTSTQTIILKDDSWHGSLSDSWVLSHPSLIKVCCSKIGTLLCHILCHRLWVEQVWSAGRSVQSMYSLILKPCGCKKHKKCLSVILLDWPSLHTPREDIIWVVDMILGNLCVPFSTNGTECVWQPTLVLPL